MILLGVKTMTYVFWHDSGATSKEKVVVLRMKLMVLLGMKPRTTNGFIEHETKDNLRLYWA